MSHEDQRPEYERLAAALRKRIRRRYLRPGQQLPSTRELADRYEVASATVVGAINSLKAEGYVVGRKGKGVYVRESPTPTVGSAAYIAPETGRYAYDLLDVAEVEAPPDVADVLGDVTVVLRYRLMRLGGDPVELSWSYYPLDLVSGSALAQRRAIKGGAPQVLAELGEPPARVVDQVSARQPDTDETVMLEIPRGVPVLEQYRVVYSASERPVEVSILVKAGHRYQLRTEYPA